MEYSFGVFYSRDSMNILVVCNKFPYPPTDGGQIATFAMIRGFSELGHTVTVAAINTKKHFYDISTLPKPIQDIADFRTVYVDTDLTAKDAFLNLCFSSLPYTATRFITDSFSSLLRHVFSEKEFDLVQLEGLYMCAYIPLIRECSQAKVSYRAHNVEYEIWERMAQETRNVLKRFYLKNLTKRLKQFEHSMLNKYDCIVPITQRDSETYNTIGNVKPSFVAPAGIFVSDLPQIVNSTEQSVSLFHLGALDWGPNQQGLLWFLINCWPKIKERYPKMQLFIAGRNAPRWLVEQISVDGVVYVGEVPDAYEFMSQHTIMIVPLLAGGGMRIKILEGLAYGKVIVSTAIGAEGIPAENGSEICIANIPSDFVDSILTLVHDRQNIEKLSGNAQLFIKERFDNVQIVSKLYEFYINKVIG